MGVGIIGLSKKSQLSVDHGNVAGAQEVADIAIGPVLKQDSFCT